MLVRSLALLIALAAASAHAAPRRVLFVDNRVPPGGAGSSRQPFSTIAEAAAALRDFEVIFVAETDQPYQASITLRRGQMLIGSAYGLDAIRTEFKTELDAPPTPAAQGPGPLIQGSVTLAGDNVLAGVTIETTAAAAVSAASPVGPVDVLGTYIRTSRGAPGVSLSNNDFPAHFTGGGIVSTGGGGVTMYGGRGEVIFDRFGVTGTFTNVLDIRGRTGPVAFRGRAVIDATDATLPAVSIANCSRVDIEVPLRVAGQARGLSITQSTAKITGDASRLSSATGPALEIRDSAVEALFANVSAGGGDRGIVVDKLRGTLAITGGTVRNARFYGVTISQSSGIRLLNMTLADDGAGDRSKCDEEIEAKTNLRCGAALHLRHVSRSEFEGITITGGKQIGLNANNLEDVTCGGLKISGVGDEPGETSVVLDEMKGSVKFSRCAFEDAAGGAVVVAQQFNSAKIVFDRCAFGAAARPTGAAHLVIFRTSGSAKLDVEMRSAEMHDNAASALRGEARGASAMSLLVADSRLDRFGGTAIEIAARDQARAAFTLRGTTIVTPGNDSLPAVDVAAAGAASACADMFGNQVVNGGGVPAVRLSPSVGPCH